MRIRNESRRTFCFNGGSIAPKRVVDIENKAIAEALIKAYPNELVALDSLKAEVIKDDEKAELVAKAKELGVKGNVEGMKLETLKAKIAELSK